MGAVEPAARVDLHGQAVERDEAPLDLGDDDVERYLIGSIEEKRDDVDIMSPTSPLGAALLGRSQGDVVEYTVPSGAVLKVEVVEVA